MLEDYQKDLRNSQPAHYVDIKLNLKQIGTYMVMKYHAAVRATL